MKKIVGVALNYFNVNNNSYKFFWMPSPNRHHHLFSAAKILGNWNEEEVLAADQGFAVSFGTPNLQFCNRKAAWRLAVKNGQLINILNSPPGILFSEHLW